MKWGFRWYGENDDSIPLKHVRQIPGMKGVVGTLLNKLPGDVWEVNEIQALKESIKKENLELLGIESVAIHDAIKAGTDERDLYIDNYIQTIKNLSTCGVDLICYSFKPIFGWAKTELFYENEDGSHSLVYDQKVVENMEPGEMYTLIHSQSKGFRLPGWEEERLKKFQSLLDIYEGITEEKLFENLSYFLNKIIPVCEEMDVKMAIHPDDPPWEIFGLPRITKNLDDIQKILNIVDSPYNGITLCTGSLGADPDNDLVEIINTVGNRINFVHFRNVEFMDERKFKEVAHPSAEGSLDMYAIMKALVDNGFDGVIRPDHGRTVWGEVAMPGYGLYDRAMGITYMQGLYEAIKRNQ
ncbi:mannonate dehydratase [Vagococcus lutrae]|uniref:Mannonate dehydratase n=1 Tax=Vagococcus lutrae TaxID=81947 RepID=A0AAE9XHP1_9ENTE|nr:mannonate dehydratase [Vagococcus lutrae]MDT2808639.1 mannonate dehydratase [Vagococcus lutrae]MDT2811363.1 mannonate dehydratase [Vagococcus lutrae]UQF71327.1 mannonate dehydratase [Vagococcus lutrae]WCG22541.1 mannonate dehydratase [Vagococcus lutrae]GEQ61182.1 mannonate dehydratase [Vagococcus lutrae]